MTRRHRQRAFTPAELEERVAVILKFAHPEPAPPPPPPAPRRPRSTSPWALEVLDDRSFIICQRWAQLSGTNVALSDARRVARLRLPLPVILATLQSVWERPRGLGACWEDLRRAEAQLAALSASQ